MTATFNTNQVNIVAVLGYGLVPQYLMQIGVNNELLVVFYTVTRGIGI